MEPSKQIQLLIEELGPACELVDEIYETGEGQWAIVNADLELVIGLSHEVERERIELFTEVGSPAEENRLQTYELILILNFTNDPNTKVALDGPGGQVVQTCSLPVAGLDLEALLEALLAFITSAQCLRDVMTQGGASLTESPADDDVADAGNSIRV